MDVRSIAAIGVALVACVATPARGQVRAELVAGGFTQPVAFVQDPSDATVQLVVQQDGRIRALRDGAVQEADYLDLRAVVRNSGEQGLLGLAFAPDYAASGRVFVNFVNTSGHTVIARFRRSAADPLRADPSSRFDLRWPDGQRIIEQPFSNHNGGNLAFGPDGFLYIGMGDGGSGNDPFHNAQNPQTLLGKMLRINVSVPDADPEGYDVPATNPFVGQPGVLGEIWSFGLRNPWRWSFDDPARGGTGALVIADVGQNNWEEISYEPAGRGGRNYGWRNREGAHDNVLSLPPFSLPLIDPIVEYPHGQGSSITGGVVYRGSALGASFRGRYLYADFVQSRVWSVRLTVNAVTREATAGDLVEHTAELGQAAENPSSFGVDAAGEVYIVSYAGSIFRLLGVVEPGPGFSSGLRPRPPGVEPIGRAVPRNAVASQPGLATRLQATEPMAPSSRPHLCLATDLTGILRLFDLLTVGEGGWLVIDAPETNGDEIVVRLELIGRQLSMTIRFVPVSEREGEPRLTLSPDRC
jgi:glucose/arabinose dehydrogenase